ncbi:RNA polymerase factor sigma-54 [Silvimonas amylolytica]|uniref:RNA polymerase sigma-54 factor n=1 Tax=Silvimonas amylolytica TaxID=449663 RepID=A0ABQ2PQ51_9NEIS|nr:RNA polymerase factor sigma-54 [Silvimonas amylolytica]GGP27755.1 RNA polymerase sigma-54 factor [Silvimonas amylolytica]
MKQSLQLRLSQQLNLTPQLQQSIKLLQLSTLDFQTEIERYLLENPLLEQDSAGSSSSDSAENSSSTDSTDNNSSSDDSYGTGGDDMEWGGGSRSSDDDDDFDPATQVARELTLREHLLDQAGVQRLPDRDHAALAFMIDAVDEEGFLPFSLEELLEQIPPEIVSQLELEIDDLAVALARLKQFDPVGVGARNTAEALSLQLRQLESTPACVLARQIVGQHLDLLAGRDYTKLKRLLKCDDAALKAAQTVITSLNPRPAAQWAALTPRYVVPDVLVQKIKGQWQVRLNPAAMPRLRINQVYADILQRSEGGVLARELQEAKWLVKSVQQRFETILRVAQAIVERQRAFFEHGEVAMRPLVLRDIAMELDLHESTVSRVTTQKYMASPRGLLEFKYFFGSHVDTEAGGECSATAIKALIRQMIQNEDKTRPLSDSAIADALSGQGIVVARRTVAKYREGMNVPPVNLRKNL